MPSKFEEGYNPGEIKESSREENARLFKKDAEKILGEQYNGMEIGDIVSYFNDENVKKWSKELSELSRRIDVNKETLSEEEVVVMKAKFIGRMTMYCELLDDISDAKLSRNREKEINKKPKEGESEGEISLIEKPKNCLKCGKLLPSSVIFCPYCGNKF